MASRNQENGVLFGLKAPQIQNIGAWLLLDDFKTENYFRYRENFVKTFPSLPWM